MHDAPISPRARTWRWWVAGLLLLATMLNYMDRQTLANLSVRITDEMGLSQEQYGTVETAFGLAFATGSLAFGILADRLPVRWLYPAVVVAWSGNSAHKYQDGRLSCDPLKELHERDPCAALRRCV